MPSSFMASSTGLSMYPKSSAINGNEGNVPLSISKKAFDGVLTQQPIHGSFSYSIHLPVCYKTAEMVQPQQIAEHKVVAYTVHPPFKPCFFVLFPIVDGVAPKLPSCAKIIGWYAADITRFAIAVQS